MPKQEQGKVGRWLTRTVAGLAVGAFVKHVTLTYIVPLGLPVVTAIAGYAQGLPWMWILVGAGLMFGGVSHGLVKFDDWRERRRVSGKLTFRGLKVARAISSGGVVLIVEVGNRSSLRVEYRAQARVRIRNSVPEKDPEFAGVIGPHARALFYSGAIDVGVRPMPGSLDGSFDMTFNYGRQGTRLKHTLVVRKGVTVVFDAQGNITGHIPFELGSPSVQ